MLPVGKAGFGALRLAVLAWVALALGACAQNRADVLVNVGADLPVSAKAKDYAALYVPYAMMATAAYADMEDLDRRNHCPSATLLAHARPGESKSDADYRNSVRGWIGYLHGRGWDCRFGVYGSLPCPPRAGGEKCKPVGGLQFHVWRRLQGGRCREAVIAFRGTDKTDVGDWVSNFRWLYRLAPKFDQYSQIKTHIKQIVARIKKNGCAGGVQFAATGHSLGGGLAQQAAYADATGSIRYVYAFDPSPVTGFFDVSALVREKSTRGLGVDRAFEAGEILALPRLIIENIYPPAPCDPRIRTVRFNLLTGLGIAQHSISGLTKRLRAVADEPDADPLRVTDTLQARDCKGGPLMAITPPA
ncbi:MAG: DUF2974 domain-containing protein [Pseudolabrys sp.]|nr:DUF2974 domain-containing protein [Pseudolabrys sp.]